LWFGTVKKVCNSTGINLGFSQNWALFQEVGSGSEFCDERGKRYQQILHKHNILVFGNRKLFLHGNFTASKVELTICLIDSTYLQKKAVSETRLCCGEFVDSAYLVHRKILSHFQPPEQGPNFD